MLNMDANTDYEAFQTTKKGSYREHSNCPEIHPYSLLIMAVPLTIQSAKRVDDIKLAAELIRIFHEIQRFQGLRHIADVAVGASLTS